MAGSALKMGADLEQSVGGIETLFKGSASIVINNAQMAYKTAGVNAIDYMDQVTSFSASLLQSLDGDTVRAAAAADMAIIDMADNANKMGSNIGDIQNAYQGFAKQNYTMLDNLKLGYGGTKTEMERLLADAEKLTGIKYDIDNLSDVYEAIHVIQGELDITGTTAKEAADTLSGAFLMAKTSFDNFLMGVGDSDALVDSISTLADVASNSLSELLPRLSSGLSEVFEKLMPLVPPLLEKLLPSVIEGASNLLNGIMSAMPEIVKVVADVLPMIVDAIGSNIPLLAEAGLSIITGILEGMKTYAPNLSESFDSIIDVISRIGETIASSGIGESLVTIFDKIGDAVNAFAPTLIEIFGDALIVGIEGVSTVLEFLADNFDAVATVVLAVVTGFAAIKTVLAIQGIITGVSGAFTFLSVGLKAAGGAAGVLTKVVAALGGPIGIIIGVVAALAAGFIYLWNTNDGFKEAVTNAWNAIKETASNVWDGLVTFFTETIPEAFNNAKDGIVNAVDNIKEGFNSVVEWFQSIPDKVGAAFESFKTMVSDTVTAIAEWFTSLPERIGEALGEIIASVVTWALELKESAATKVSEFIEAVVEFFDVLPDRIAHAMGVVIGKVIEWALNLYNIVTVEIPKIITSVVTFFSELPGKIWDAIISAKDRIIEWGTLLVTNATQKIRELVDSVQKFFSELPGKIWNAIITAKDRIVEWGTLLITNATQKVRELVDSVQKFFSELPGKIWNAIVGAVEKVATWGSNLIQTAKQKISEMVENVRTTASELPDKIYNGIKGAVDKVTQWGKDLVAKGKQAIADMIDGIVSKAGELAGKISEIGKNIVEGVLKGIQNARDWFLGQIQSFFQNMVDGVKEGLGINSPSKVFAEIGKFCIEGFVGQLSKMSGLVKSTMTDTFNPDFDINTPQIDNIDGHTMLNPNRSNDPYFSGKGGSHSSTQNHSGINVDNFNQYIQSVPQTPSEIMSASIAALERARWQLD